jgi:hypothetical protein
MMRCSPAMKRGSARDAAMSSTFSQPRTMRLAFHVGFFRWNSSNAARASSARPSCASDTATSSA